jgi:hypothetical protein
MNSNPDTLIQSQRTQNETAGISAKEVRAAGLLLDSVPQNEGFQRK